jgi:CHAD domain-containing protein
LAGSPRSSSLGADGILTIVTAPPADEPGVDGGSEDPPSLEVLPGPSVGAVLRRCLGTDVARLVASDPVARLGEDPEGVHQARVASRRLRSHLATFGDVLREGPTVRLVRDLRWLGRALGVVRDLDVLRGRLASSVKAIDPLAREGGLALLARADGERRSAITSLDEVLGSPRYRVLLEQLAGTVAAPPFRRSAGLPADQFLTEAIESRYRTLRAAIDALPAAPRDVELHAVRILAKPTRYAAEAGVAVLGSRCGRLAKRVTELCDNLGDLNDGSRVSVWLDAAGVEPSAASTVARVRAIEIGRMADARVAWVRTDAKLREVATELGWDAAEPRAAS